MGDEDAVRPRYWIDHLTRTVRFADAMMTVTDDTSAVLVEVGPGQALANLARNMLAPSQHGRVISCMGRTSGIGGDLSAALEGLGRIWLSGVRVDWRRSTSTSGRAAFPCQRIRSSAKVTGSTETHERNARRPAIVARPPGVTISATGSTFPRGDERCHLWRALVTRPLIARDRPCC